MTAASPSVVFRADGTPESGFGHLVRCSALAQAVRIAGLRAVLATATAAHVPPFVAAAFDAIEDLDGDCDEWAALSTRLSGQVEAMVIDHYGRDAGFEACCSRLAARICAIDDFGTRSHAADIVIDQNLGADPRAYADLVPARSQVLCGPSFALVRASFPHMRALASPRPNAPPAGPAVGRVLLAPGATDTADLAGRLVPALAGRGLAVDILLARAARNVTRITMLADESAGVTLHADAGEECAARLMAGADLAISAGGSAAWERCTLGLPSLLVRVADNQAPVVAPLVAAGAAMDLGSADSGLADRAIAGIEELAATPDRLAAMRKRAARICDGLGSFRVALTLLPERNADGNPVILRPARQADEATILHWQRQPGLRRFSRNPGPPTAEEHAVWYARKLEDPGCVLSIIEVAGSDAGFVRLDRRDPVAGDPAFEVSIGVPQIHQGQGTGGAALRAARRLAPFARLDAFIDPANAASRAVFCGAGYFPSGEHWYYNPPLLPMQHSK